MSAPLEQAEQITRPTDAELLKAALGYARRGWFVFPCRPDTKLPATRNGMNDATNDPEKIKEWWGGKYRGCNIGLHCGRSGLAVLDVDTYKPQCEFRIWLGNREIPHTLVQRSSRGGTHYFFEAEDGKLYAGAPCKGVEIRHNAYVMIEPSTYVDPDTSIRGRYELQTDDEPAPAPDWLPSREDKRERRPGVQYEARKGGFFIDTGDLDRVQRLLRESPNTLAARDDWVKVGLALKGNLGDSVLEEFVAWSVAWEGEPDAAKKEANAREFWRTANPDGRVTLGTVFHFLPDPAAPDNSPKEPTPGPGHNSGEVTEDSVAIAFTERHRGKLLFDHDAGKWYEWSGDHWRADTTHVAFSYARGLARAAAAGGKPAVVVAAGKAAFAGGVERLARADRAHAVTQAVWDSDPWLLGCPGTTVDLRTGGGRKPDAADRITKRTSVAPSLTANCPRWLEFLEQATGEDEELIRFLRAWCGYCLTGDTREHVLLFIFGPGQNGKSVFLNVVQALLGDYAVTASMDAFTAARADRHPTELAMLRGARFVTASETEEGRAWAESRIKQLTGGDRISARFMRQDFFEFKPQFKLTIVGNHKPTLVNVDDAARRRFRLAPFTRKPPRPDRELEAKLLAEGPGILRWMIQGCQDWNTNGLPMSRSVADATADYFEEQDVFGAWLAECCRVESENEHLRTAANELFQSWRKFSQKAGEEPGTQKRFGESLRRRGFKKVRTMHARMWQGVALRHQPNWHDA